MSHIPREIRRKLEGSLPSYVLEYLTEKFTEYEEKCQKVKELENKVVWLEDQLQMKDNMLMQQMSGSQYQGQGQDRPIMGYVRPGRTREIDLPWMHWEYGEEYYPESRGRKRDNQGRFTDRSPYYDVRSQGRGQQGRSSGRGSQGGGGGSQQGGQSGNSQSPQSTIVIAGLEDRDYDNGRWLPEDLKREQELRMPDQS
jgi:uncharacterized membrane protein YgcG